MRNSLVRKICALAVIVPALVCVAGASSDESQKSSGQSCAIAITVQQIKARAVYKVNSRIANDLLRELGDLALKRGRNCPVVVLVDSSAAIRQLFDVEMIADKAGFKNIRTFIYDPANKTYMSEIRVVRGVPFSTHPS